MGRRKGQLWWLIESQPLLLLLQLPYLYHAELRAQQLCWARMSVSKCLRDLVDQARVASGQREHGRPTKLGWWAPREDDMPPCGTRCQWEQWVGCRLHRMDWNGGWRPLIFIFILFLLKDKNLDYWMDHLSFKIKLSYFTSQNIYHTTTIVRSFRKKEEEMRIVYRQALGWISVLGMHSFRFQELKTCLSINN